MTLLPVEQALIKVTESLTSAPLEHVPLASAQNRVLAEDIIAKLTQPPFNSSAMDGYAVLVEDLVDIPVTLDLIGEAAAGHAYNNVVKKGQAVRIFTGAPVPEGADTVIMQENTSRSDDNKVTINKADTAGANIRLAGVDFRENEVLLKAGQRLSAKDLALAAAMNHAQLPVYSQPVVAILATGDELVEPGQIPNPDQIVSSIPYGLIPMIENWGAKAVYLGIAKDRIESLEEKIEEAKKADILITLGGASVGDHDLVQKVLKSSGMDLNFWKVAIRPGKPIMYGQLGSTHVLGLPGNPVSAFICAQLFLSAMLRKILGSNELVNETITAILSTDLSENGSREHYMRATTVKRDDGIFEVSPAPSQDSSLISTYALSNCLIVREPHASKAKKGDVVRIIPNSFT